MQAEGAEPQRTQGYTEGGMETNQITGAVVDAAMRVHSRLGPGLLEQPYKKCLEHELVLRGFTGNTEVYLPVLYDSVLINFNVVHLKEGIERFVF
jgi:hypothetical protein